MNHGEFLRFVAISKRIVIDAPQDDVDPFVECKLATRIFVFVEIDVVGAKIFEIHQLNFALAIAIFGRDITQFDNAPALLRLDELFAYALHQPARNHRILRSQAIIGQSKRRLALGYADVDAEFREDLYRLSLIDHAVLKGIPIVFMW